MYRISEFPRQRKRTIAIGMHSNLVRVRKFAFFYLKLEVRRRFKFNKKFAKKIAKKIFRVFVMKKKNLKAIFFWQNFDLKFLLLEMDAYLVSSTFLKVLFGSKFDSTRV